MQPSAPPPPRRSPRSVDVTVLAPPTPHALRDLDAIARYTACRLTGVTPLDPGWRCRFALAADGDDLDDAPLFDLLRNVGRLYRWTAVDRHPPTGVEHLPGQPPRATG